MPRLPQTASQTDDDGEPDAARIDEADRGVLDYGWWASNGPTGGYLTSLALDIACRTTGITPSWARSATLHVVRLAAADRYHTTVTVVTGGTGIAVANVVFTQEEPFATASVYFSPPRGASTAADATPPAVLPPEAYAEMATDLRAPPIMSQFSYRPTAAADGRNAHNGWDLVWVRPIRPTPTGRIGAVRLLDSWYPANHMRLVREYLAGATQLTDPPAVNLLAASVLFPAGEGAYRTDKSTLVASRIDSVTHGHHHERVEAWSETGQLLLAANILRRNQRSEH